MIAEYLLTNWNVSLIGISDLDIIWELRFGIWDFRLVFRETNYYYLSPLESTLTLT